VVNPVDGDRAVTSIIRDFQLTVARALWEIRRMQSHLAAEAFCIPKTPFVRVIRAITGRFHSGLKFQSDALVLMQIAAENFLTMVLEMW
jgi:histone H3/H4